MAIRSPQSTPAKWLERALNPPARARRVSADAASLEVRRTPDGGRLVLIEAAKAPLISEPGIHRSSDCSAHSNSHWLTGWTGARLARHEPRRRWRPPGRVGAFPPPRLCRAGACREAQVLERAYWGKEGEREPPSPSISGDQQAHRPGSTPPMICLPSAAIGTTSARARAVVGPAGRSRSEGVRPAPATGPAHCQAGGRPG